MSSSDVDALVGVLVEQGVEHRARLVAVLGEVVALADVVGALLARERRLVEGDVADQVERVEVAADASSQRLEQHAAFSAARRRWPACGRLAFHRFRNASRVANSSCTVRRV